MLAVAAARPLDLLPERCDMPPNIVTAKIGRKTQIIHLGTRLHACLTFQRLKPIVADLMACSLALLAIVPQSLTPVADVGNGAAEAVLDFWFRAVRGALSNRTVSVYSSTPSPRRQPHARQKRISLGISVRQFGQALTSCTFAPTVFL